MNNAGIRSFRAQRIGKKHAGSRWNSLEIAKLAVSLLTPLVVFFVGYTFNENEKRSEVFERRRTAISHLHEKISQRRLRSDAHLAAIYRYVNTGNQEMLNELLKRRELYEESFNEWGIHVPILVGRAVDPKIRHQSEEIFDRFIVKRGFYPVHVCVGDAYNIVIKKQNDKNSEFWPDPVVLENLEACGVSQLLEFTAACGASIINKFYEDTDNRQAGTFEEVLKTCQFSSR